MIREVEIGEKALEYSKRKFCPPDSALTNYDIFNAFIAGAEWADEHPSQKPTQEQRDIKANKAPEKIYIFENPILDFTKLSIRQSVTDIEYIRTDAFIDKACNLMQHWILEHDYVDIMELEDYIKQKMEE